MTCGIRFRFSLMTLLYSAMLLGCGPSQESDAPRHAAGAGVSTPAAAETEAVASAADADAADDPEIWADPADPRRAVIVGTDKKAGLYVYGLDGKILQFLAAGRLNNVDLRPGLKLKGRDMVLIAASDRVRRAAALFLLDPATLHVTPWGLLPADVGEPYGICLGRRAGGFDVLVIGKDGEARQLAISAVDDRPVGREVRRFAVGSQAEGCVVDDVSGALYVGEEAKGVWRYRFDPASGATRTQLAAAPSAQLKPDVEGVTLIRDGAQTHLIVSSQGDSAFAVWRVDGATPAYRGRFSIGAGNSVDAVTGTDGVAALGGAVGPYAEGLVVAQDDVNDGNDANKPQSQNFKLVGWREVKAALGI
jgi:3-phytase